MTEKKVIQKIFNEIDWAINSTRSDKPVEIKNSKFLKKYNEIKKRYIK